MCFRSLLFVFTAVLSTSAQTSGPATLETANGLHTAVFNLPQGKVSVYLPDDIHAGDSISGTVSDEPAGHDDKARRKNTDTLEGYVVDVGGRTGYSRGGKLNVLVPVSALGSVALSLRDPAGRVVASVAVPARPLLDRGPIMPEPLNPVKARPGGPIMPEPLNPVKARPGGPIMPEPLNPVKARPEAPIIPEPLNPAKAVPGTAPARGPVPPEPVNPGGTLNRGPVPPEPVNPGGTTAETPPPAPSDSLNGHFRTAAIHQSGHPFVIHGRFDGNSMNTHVSIGDKTADVLAESPRQTVVAAPPTVQGSTAVEVTETPATGQPSNASLKVRFVALRLSAGKLHLMRGEKTELKVEVSGLDGLAEPVPLTITNRSPETINLEGGNTQGFTVQPGQVSSSGSYTTTRDVTSVQAGTFRIDSEVVYDTPSAPAAPPPPPPPQTPTKDTGIDEEACVRAWGDAAALVLWKAAFDGQIQVAQKLVASGEPFENKVKPATAGQKRKDASPEERAALLALSAILSGQNIDKAYVDQVEQAAADAAQGGLASTDEAKQEPLRQLIAYLHSIGVTDPTGSEKAMATHTELNKRHLQQHIDSENARYARELSHAIASIVSRCFHNSLDEYMKADLGKKNSIWAYLKDLIEKDDSLRKLVAGNLPHGAVK